MTVPLQSPRRIQRNVLADDSQRHVATAMTQHAVSGGAQASGRAASLVFTYLHPDF